MKRILLVAMLMTVVSLVHASTYQVTASTTSAQTVFTGGCFVKGIIIANTSGSAITYSIYDNATNKIDLSIPNNTTQSINFITDMQEQIAILTSLKVVVSTVSANSSATLFFLKK